MPMQLAGACMSAEFINLHHLWAGVEGRGDGVVGGEKGSSTRAGFVSAKPGSERREKRE